jgi:hypothetical protein
MGGSFVQMAVQYFGFLERDYGFRRNPNPEVRSFDHFIGRGHGWIVRWESDAVFLEVQFDYGRSYEVDVVVGQTRVLYSGRELAFGVGEIARVAGLSWEPGRVFVARTEGALHRVFDELASVLKTAGAGALRNDPDTYSALLQQLNRESAAYTKDLILGQMRGQAQQAWERREFHEAVRVYAEHLEDLTALERRKYDYALRRTQACPPSGNPCSTGAERGRDDVGPGGTP